MHSHFNNVSNDIGNKIDLQFRTAYFDIKGQGFSRMGAGISKVIHGKIIKKLLNRGNLSLFSNFQTEYFLDYVLRIKEYQLCIV